MNSKYPQGVQKQVQKLNLDAYNNSNNGFHFLSDINTNKYHSSLVQNIKHKVI